MSCGEAEWFRDAWHVNLDGVLWPFSPLVLELAVRDAPPCQPHVSHTQNTQNFIYRSVHSPSHTPHDTRPQQIPCEGQGGDAQTMVGEPPSGISIDIPRVSRLWRGVVPPTTLG